MNHKAFQKLSNTEAFVASKEYLDLCRKVNRLLVNEPCDDMSNVVYEELFAIIKNSDAELDIAEKFHEDVVSGINENKEWRV